MWGRGRSRVVSACGGVRASVWLVGALECRRDVDRRGSDSWCASAPSARDVDGPGGGPRGRDAGDGWALEMRARATSWRAGERDRRRCGTRYVRVLARRDRRDIPEDVKCQRTREKSRRGLLFLISRRVFPDPVRLSPVFAHDVYRPHSQLTVTHTRTPRRTHTAQYTDTDTDTDHTDTDAHPGSCSVSPVSPAGALQGLAQPA